MAKKKYNKSRRDLFCYGCAFSKDDCGFPGQPGSLDAPGRFSPCHLCMRSHRVQDLVDHGEPLLYDGYPDGSTPVALPMDCYISSDMLDQTEMWTDAAVEHATSTQVKQAVTEIAREYGVSLPDHEVLPN